MSHWPITPEDISRPAYRSLAQGIAAAIDSGRLGPGDRLPPHRDLAWQLGVSVQTVSRAYEELIRADLVSGEVGRGSFVKPAPAQGDAMPWHRSSEGKVPADLSLMTPVRLPEADAAWAEALAHIAGSIHETAMHSFLPGELTERHHGMAEHWLRRCGMDVTVKRILMTNGVTPAMSAILSTVAGPGDVIATDSATCHSLIPLARHLHLRLQAIPGDEDGMDPDALADAADASGGSMKAVFLLPSGAGPEARIVPRARRQAIAQAVRDTRLTLIESDPTGPLVPDLPPPLASFAPERSFYLTGLTKCLSPGLRLGFATLPESHADCTKDRHLSFAWMATPLMAEIARHWIETGIAEGLLQRQRSELKARNRLMVQVLANRTKGHDHGLHRWMPLPQGIDEKLFVNHALECDVAVTPAAGFRVAGRAPAVRLCPGNASLETLEEALLRLRPILPRKASSMFQSA